MLCPTRIQGIVNMKNHKTFILTLTLMLCMACSMYGQGKSYVTVLCPMNTYSSQIKLSGDIPSTMKQDYSYMDFGYPRAVNNYYLIGDVLNMLASNGFYVEKMDAWSNGTTDMTTYLCSRSGSGPASAMQRVQREDGDEVREIARYNLQGIPVSESDKGVQIIVFSNYTTKTVVVE